MRIGVITSGGDSPGMNPCLAQIVSFAKAKGHEVIGYRHGFIGILEDDYLSLDIKDILGLHKRGGTILGTGRLPELKEEEVQKKIVNKLKNNKIDGLIVIGGDGSFNGALAISKHVQDLAVIGIPGTIDNNIYGSEYTLGYDTAINKLVTYIDDIYDTAMALPNRIFFVETLGANDGYLTNSVHLMGMVDFPVLVEAPMTNEEICHKIKSIFDKKEKEFVLVTFAEGLGQMFEAARYVEDKLGIRVKSNLIGYAQRGGVPTALDRIHASMFAKTAVDAMDSGQTNQYVVFKDGKYKLMDIVEASKRKTFNIQKYF